MGSRLRLNQKMKQPINLTRIMQMRNEWIHDNEPRVLANANKNLYDKIIEEVVHKGRDSLRHYLPIEVRDFPTMRYIVRSMMDDMKLVFPDFTFIYDRASFSISISII